MNARVGCGFALLCAALLAPGAGAQEPAPEGPSVLMVEPGMPGPGAVVFGGQIELLGFGGLRGGKVVKDAPFTAVAVGETKQTLADGTTISHKFESKLYRDAEGRFRKEGTLPSIGPLAAKGKAHSFVFVMDPVAGTAYELDAERKIARQLPPHRGGGPGAGDDVRYEAGPGGFVKFEKAMSGGDANLKKESLGTQTINGLNAEGTRYTRTIPAGQIGNDRPLTIVKEEWYSPELQIVVQSRRSDPMFGQTVYSLTSLQRGAPNANLFTVPSDYTIRQGPTFHHQGRAGKGEGAPPPRPADDPGSQP